MKYTGTKSAEDVERRRLTRHVLFRSTPADIEAWVDANVNTLEDAKDALKILAKAIALTARRNRRGEL